MAVAQGWRHVHRGREDFMQRHRTYRWLAVSVLVLAGFVAHGEASAQGWLAGASVGGTKQYDYEVGGEIANSDDTSFGYRAFGGYTFPPGVGIIGSYVDLGDATYDGPAFGGFTDKLSAKGFDLSFLGAWSPGKQDRVNVFGLVGMFYFKQDVHYVDPSGSFDYEDKGTSFSYGLGTDVSIGAAAKWGVHVEYQRFTNVGDDNNSGHEYDRDFFSVGADYRFGK